jgi:hypothetical protein
MAQLVDELGRAFYAFEETAIGDGYCADALERVEQVIAKLQIAMGLVAAA